MGGVVPDACPGCAPSYGRPEAQVNEAQLNEAQLNEAQLNEAQLAA
jgi:hypothetical protein